MFQHLRSVLLATVALMMLDSMHTLSTIAVAEPISAQPVMRTEPERLPSAAVSTLAGAGLRSISIGF